MSTEVETSSQQTTQTQQAGTQERVLQALATQAARRSVEQLGYQSDYLNAVQGLPFDRGAYRNLSREELGLTPTQFPQSPERRDGILRALQNTRGLDISNPAVALEQGRQQPGGLSQDEILALQESAQEQEAQQRYIADAEARYGQVAQTPLAQLTQRQIQQELGILPLRQEAESAQLRQNVAQSKLGEQYQNQVAPLQLQLAGREAQLGLDRFGQLTGPETAGAEQNLALARASQAGAYGTENALRSDLTDLAISGRAASPAQQVIIDKIYRDRLAGVEQDLARQYEDSTRLLPEVATARGLRVNSADLPDRYALARREFLRQGGQAASALGAEAASASLNYPLQLGNLNVQQQYLTGQQQARLPGAIQSSVALRQGQPQYFPGYQSEGAAFGGASGSNAYGPFSVPLGLQGSVIGGSPFSVQAQQPLLQSRLANVTQTGSSQQSTGGVIPALGAAGGLLSGAGSLGLGAASARKQGLF